MVSPGWFFVFRFSFFVNKLQAQVISFSNPNIFNEFMSLTKN